MFEFNREFLAYTGYVSVEVSQSKSTDAPTFTHIVGSVITPLGAVNYLLAGYMLGIRFSRLSIDDKSVLKS